MRNFFSLLALLAFLASGGAAHAEFCDEMLMPVVQLKQISRGFSGYHSGVDLMAPYGSPVRAAMAGTVVFVGRYYAYGNIIDLRHENGVVTRYAHLSAFGPHIHVGVHVRAGEQIAEIGTSGNAHGPHLHFEVRVNGRAIDPKPAISLTACAKTPGHERLEEAEAPLPSTLHAEVRAGRPE